MADIISLFSGCGGLDLGFEQVGDYRTVWANDFNHDACETFRRHFGDVIREGDVEQIDPYNDPTIPNCDLILGGFPCQPFSQAGLHKGFSDTRGTLFFEIERIIKEKKESGNAPKAFLLENVKQLIEMHVFLHYDEFMKFD